MRTKSRFIFSLALSAGLLAVGCTDLPTQPDLAPMDVVTSEDLGGLGDLVGDVVNDLETLASSLVLLERRSPLAHDITVTKTIGRRGGVITIREAGFKLRIPRGALRTRTEITVTALAGDKVAYEFGPHGLQFRRPVRVMQKANSTALDELADELGIRNAYSPRGVRALLPHLWGVYFEGTVEDFVPLELFRTVFNRRWIQFKTDHFSGYALASDR